MPRLASHCWWSRWNGDKELTTKCRNKQLRRWPHPVFEELFERFWERKTIRKLAGYCMLMSSILRILCGLGQGLTSWCWFRLELLELKPFPEDGANLGKPLPHPSPKPILPGCQAARPMPYRGPESIMIRKEHHDSKRALRMSWTQPLAYCGSLGLRADIQHLKGQILGMMIGINLHSVGSKFVPKNDDRLGDWAVGPT